MPVIDVTGGPVRYAGVPRVERGFSHAGGAQALLAAVSPERIAPSIVEGRPVAV